MPPSAPWTTNSSGAGDGDPGWAQRTGGKKETIELLEDTTGSGIADKASVFYTGFDLNQSDILAGVLWYEGGVYATLAPDLWLLRDTHAGQTRSPTSRPSGLADEVRSLSHGYGVHLSYSGHNMHGLTVGPDGKIYFTIGDKGLNVTTADGRHLVYPFCGSCLRCNPDGSGLEVFAYGLRNTQEVAFDKYGNLFGVDNDGDFPTERERLVYITENSDTGWRFHWQYRSKNFDVTAPPEQRLDRYNVWLNERLWVPHFAGQAAYITPALANYTDGPCGFKYASEGSLNERYREHFFVTEFPNATIRSFAVKPKGAYFALTDDQIVARGMQCTGLAVAPDGALYGAEWGKSGFKLGHTGSVIKLDDPAAANDPVRMRTHKLLGDGPSGRSVKELVAQLDEADMRVRLDAQFELVRRRAREQFEQVIASPKRQQMPTIHAFWGLAQLADAKAIDSENTKKVVQEVEAACGDADPEIRAQGAKLLGKLAPAEASATKAAVRLLSDPNARVKFFAAMALGQMKDRTAVPPLLHVLAENRPVDPYLRHGAVIGLAGIGDVDALLATISHPSPDVRLGSVVALRRLHAPGVARFLADRDELVATEAARAIHDDDSIPAALPELAHAAVSRNDITNEAFVRRALNSNLRVGGREQIETLIRYASDSGNPAAMRVEAIDILASWDEPLVNDRVEGCYRTWPQRSGLVLRAILEERVPALLASSTGDVARATAKLIDRLGLHADASLFAQWVTDPNKPATSRVAALGLLANRKDPALPKLIDAATASDEPLLRTEALRVLAEMDPARAAHQAATTLQSASLTERQAAFGILATLRTPDADVTLGDWMDDLLAGKVDPTLQLDVIQAARARKSPEMAKRVSKYQASLAGGDSLARYAPTLFGGDAERGRTIFAGHSEAACVRCHSTSADGTGSNVGPNLAGIGLKPDKPRRYILQSLIEPNAFVVPGFGIASFKMNDGSEVSGILKSETATDVQLLALEGESTKLLKSDIVSRTPPVSMMPAMGAILSEAEIRDVIEYVSSLKGQQIESNVHRRGAESAEK